ncbi:MAG: cytochrome b5 domain-containing protein [Candidatus Hadarchaeaceae archaeon]
MEKRMRKFSREELASYDGSEGRPAYVAYKGKVYDISSSFLWKDGRHQASHKAGEDLTGAMGCAPHGEEFLLRSPVIGIFVGT